MIPIRATSEEVFRIAYPETATRYDPTTLPEGQGSVEAFGIGCQVVSLSSRSLSENQEVLSGGRAGGRFPMESLGVGKIRPV